MLSNFVESARLLGRGDYFFRIVFLQLCAFVPYILMKNFWMIIPWVNFSLYMAIWPFIFFIVAGRVKDIEKGTQKKTRLLELWVVFSMIGLTTTAYSLFVPEEQADPLILSAMLVITIPSVFLRFYLFFKRGYLAIEKDAANQAATTTTNLEKGNVETK